MANGYYGDKAVTLPNMFQAPGQALANRISDINQSNEMMLELNYRDEQNRQADDWRKLNLIQELTDISKYQTGADVADAIGNNKMNEVYQKYTQLAGSMSAAELQANIQKEMSGVINGLNSAKQELSLADEQMKLIKQKYPSIDIGRLGAEYRQEILGRRIEGGNFKNPITVGQSQFDVLNPEFLSKYVSGNSNLIKAIQNPQGSETMKVFKGSPSGYTEYTAKLNPWKKESFDRAKLKEGFIQGGAEPKLEIKARAIPGVKAVDGQPFMAIDEDVYDRFSQDETMNLELTAATRQKYKDYDRFSPEEKNLAKRNVLYDKIKEFDQSDYYPSDVKSPPRTYNRTTINNGNNRGGGSNWDLTEYEDEPDGGKNLTVPFQGYTFTDILGSKFGAKKVVYYPSTKQFKITEYTGRDKEGNLTGETTRTVGYKTLRQDIQGSNPLVDMREFDALIKSTQTEPNKPNTPTPLGGKMVTMVLPDGRKGEIPEDKVTQFLKDNPKAKRL